jgi:hypothetical protein
MQTKFMTRRFFGLSVVAATLGRQLFSSRPAAAQGKLIDDIPASAQWISTALKSSGYMADFTPKSISEIERFFSEQTKNGAPVAGGLLSEQLGQRLFALGSYCGEVLRKELGGAWVTDDKDPQGEINIALRLGNGVTCWPVQRVMKRLKSSEDNLIAWAAGLRRG